MLKHQGLSPFVVLLQVVLVLAFTVLALTSVFLAYKHRGMSIELAQVLSLLLACLAVLFITERFTTGRWSRWSRR